MMVRSVGIQLQLWYLWAGRDHSSAIDSALLDFILASRVTDQHSALFVRLDIRAD